MSYTILIPETIAPDAFKAVSQRNDMFLSAFHFRSKPLNSGCGLPVSMRPSWA